MRDLSVAIFDENSVRLRWRGNTRVEDLTFSSALPGGFMKCSFRLVQPQGRISPLQAGQAIRISHGSQIVWAGWLEDIQIVQRGGNHVRDVLALGPYQQLTQRLITASYSATNTSWIMRYLLTRFCPDLSLDVKFIVGSGMVLTVDWENTRLSEAVNLICAVGNYKDQELLFAIWEPPGSRVRLTALSALIDDGEMEEEEVYWTNNGCTYVTSPYHSSGHSWKSEGISDSLTHKRTIEVVEGASYDVGWWVYWTAYANMTSKIVINWYGTGGGFISTTNTTALISDGTKTGWQQGTDTVSAPVGALYCTVQVSLATSAGPTHYQCVDDVYFYQSLILAEANKPRVSLWARDLSDYDYTLTTALLDEGLFIVQTTRDLANAVWAKYGDAYTDAEQDANSQALYRRRDYVVDAGDVAEADAEAQRDVYLARHAIPGTELSGFSVKTPGAVRTVQGLPVDPVFLRAGDRLKIIDGLLAGTVIMLSEVEYSAGIATCKPESYEDVTRVLAKV